MPVVAMQRVEAWERPDENERKSVLKAEIAACEGIGTFYQNRILEFLLGTEIRHIAEMDYPLRENFEAYLKAGCSDRTRVYYMKAFDQIKIHAIREQQKTIAGLRQSRVDYENEILYLPYYPELEIAMEFAGSRISSPQVWDFKRAAPGRLKQQVSIILEHILRNVRKDKRKRRNWLDILHKLYDYCIWIQAGDIGLLEWNQIEGFVDEVSKSDKERGQIKHLIDASRKIIFLAAEEIQWEANVWYMERLHIARERVDPSNPVVSFSFLEVINQKSREYLKQYMKYLIGITDLSMGNIRCECIIIRNYLAYWNAMGQDDICDISAGEFGTYAGMLHEEGRKAQTFNVKIMDIFHFYDYLRVKGHIKKVPFRYEYYLKKEIPIHHDRSVEADIYMEIIKKLPFFPEHIRLMFLHLWSTGLRLSEVCTLKGDAYYQKSGSSWLKLYQIKMRSYKRVPIPDTLYQMMQVYLKKKQIGTEDYVFQNSKGGAYAQATFRKMMKKQCKINGIAEGCYQFQTHGYRHTVATMFYDNNVSMQTVRDYLGHRHENMTRQYIDYMPKKIAEANDEFFKNPENSLAAGLPKRRKQPS